MTHVRCTYPRGLDIDPWDIVHEHARHDVFINPGEPNFKPLLLPAFFSIRPCCSRRITPLEIRGKRPPVHEI